ncbi:hypothetical protein FQN60_012414 [Etheostoma spectabile]|uniref:VHS domain-containing protein n=1 Tax=Etheostoma spectabile TaxID=54343 RepID=A0A5J5DPQ1_9PERO|nr:hypothetical protein FQN60_012414 [Etheostoma spectabile]
MATSDKQATLDSWLNQATDPNNQEDRWDCIQGFYQLVNQETDGPQVAVRLLVHKIQSPQEKQALQALTVLEACMNNCGKSFHSEVAKFRFLNELIKLLTPKYFGAWTPQKVKDRVTEVLYGWTLWLKEEPKIQEAYCMLKKQGIVKKDPKLPDTVIMAPPTQRTTDSEQEKAEKVSKRESTLEEALYERCDRLRPSLFRLASDTMDDDVALTQILAANDELTLVVNSYKDRVGQRECNGGRERSRSEENKNNVPESPREIKSYHLIDLSALDSPQTHRKNVDSPPAFESCSPMFSSLLESTFHSVADRDLNELELDHLVSKQTQETSRSYYEELLQLNGEAQMKKNAEQNGGRGVVLRARGCGGSSTTSNGTNIWSLPYHQQFTESGSTSQSQEQLTEVSRSPVKVEESLFTPQLLKNIFVPMETIKPSHLEPITLYDQGSVRVSLHFAKDSPPGYPGVAVVVISTVNTSALDVKDFLFQAAVPKTMLVKLQPASVTHLPPYNPLLPPPAISQVLLLRKVRLRYKLTLTHGDQKLDETGEIDNFPDWTTLTCH